MTVARGPLTALLIAVALPAHARACPCSDDPQSALFMTQSDEAIAANLLATSRRGLGVFDAHGAFRPFGVGESQTSEELLLRAALRLAQKLEAQAELGSARFAFHSGSVHELQTGLGDAILRARYRVAEEAMPHQPLPLPSLAVDALVRAPLGALAAGRHTGFGSGGAPLGLGAWEAGAGLNVSRSIGSLSALWLSAEAAYRFPDRRLGNERHLGPRLDAAVGVRTSLAWWLSLAAAVSGRVSGDAGFSGHRLEGSGERLVSFVCGLTGRSQGTGGLSTGLSVSIDPPFSTLSRNVVASTAIVASIGVRY